MTGNCFNYTIIEYIAFFAAFFLQNAKEETATGNSNNKKKYRQQFMYTDNTDNKTHILPTTFISVFC